MIEKVKSMTGICPMCGHNHELVTQDIIIGSGATEHLIAYIEKNSHTCVIICDTNTEKYALKIQSAAQAHVYVLPGNSHATEITTAATAEFASPLKPDLLVACGSGSIHDIVRYVACQMNVPFISYPTAASVDGFVSGVAAMTWHGQKLTFSAKAPVAVFADDDVYAQAPARLTASGAADILGKYTALADWRIAHRMTGEHLCEAIYQLEKDALDAVKETILHRDECTAAEYARRIMEGLLLSGLAMQLQGNSRPASGAEHHLSHFWEMHLIHPEIDALHGEAVGVGLVQVLTLYHSLYRRRSIMTDAFFRPDLAKVFDRAYLEEVFGALTDGILDENTPDGMASSSLSHIEVENPLIADSQIRQVLADLPTPDEARNLLRLCGAPDALSQIGLPEDDDFLMRSLNYAPYVRNRLTLMKMMSAETVTVQ